MFFLQSIKARLRILKWQLSVNYISAFTAGLILGVFIKDNFQIPYWSKDYLFIYIFPFLLYFFFSKTLGKLRKVFFLFLISTLLGFGLCSYYLQINFVDIENNYEKQVDLKGFVSNDSVFQGVSQRVELSTEDYGKINISTSRYPEYKYGDKIEVVGILKEPPEFDDFSYKEYLKVDKINYLMSQPKINFINEAPDKTLNWYASKVRNVSVEKIQQLLPEPHASLLQGMVLGVRKSMPKDFADDLQVTGTTHIIAVSGFNVVLVISLISKLSGKVSRKFLNALISIGLFFFILVVGLNNIPALRAVLMGYVFILSGMVGRKGTIIRTLQFVVVILIFQNPLIYKSLSFQLSVIATLGIVLLTSKISEKLSFVPKIIREDFSSTISAILWTSPITILGFGGFSSHSILANVLVLPFVAFITIGGIVLTIISYLYFPLAQVFSVLIWLFLEYLIRVIKLLGSWDMFYIENIQINFIVVILVYSLYLLINFEISYQRLRYKLCTRK